MRIHELEAENEALKKVNDGNFLELAVPGSSKKSRLAIANNEDEYATAAQTVGKHDDSGMVMDEEVFLSCFRIDNNESACIECNVIVCNEWNVIIYNCFYQSFEIKKILLKFFNVSKEGNEHC
jgi:hypothetical protein